MKTYVSSQLRQRRGRALALGAGILVAAASFVLLTSSAQTSELRVKGAVERNWRNAYDILVRPPGSFTPLEQQRDLVRENYLSGIFGGISLEQYRKIRSTPGVAVAAPIANVGYMLPLGRIPVSIGGLVSSQPRQVYRIRLTWLANGTSSRYPGPELYVYVTRRPLSASGGILAETTGADEPSYNVCSGYTKSKPPSNGPFSLTFSSSLFCFSTRSPSVGRDQIDYRLPRGFIGTVANVYFPVLVAAIDPAQEARLVRLQDTVVSGRYLRENERAHLRSRGGLRFRVVPFIASTQNYIDEVLQLKIERLNVRDTDLLPRKLAGDRAYDYLASLPGTDVKTATRTLAPVYDRLMRTLAAPVPVPIADAYWTTSPVRYEAAGRDRLRAVPTRNPRRVWENGAYPENGGYFPAPYENRDVQFRRLEPHPGSNRIDQNIVRLPSIRVVGRFDPGKLPGFSALSQVPLETYYPPRVEPANPVSRRALGGGPLLPTQNLGDYLAQPPLMLTTLGGLRTLIGNAFANTEREAPLSVIRVRVAGVTGPDRRSRERVRQVAEQIHRETGLTVDVTAGSSPRPILVDLPAGRFGRPALVVEEGWVKKGVSVAFVDAINKKSLVLFLLVLLVCGFFLANGVLASVRLRRREIGTLSCLGWSRRSIFTVVLAEVLIVATLAGLLGTVVALLVTLTVPLEISLTRTLLVLPVALLVALAAGLLPAFRAARGAPLDSIRAAVTLHHAPLPLRSVTGMSIANLGRLPGRTALGAGGLFVSVGALTVLLALTLAFRDVLAGTLLGQFISVQVRAVDYASVSLAILLGGLSVGDVLFLNTRERAAELATLRASGWGEREVVALISAEGLALGFLGSSLGAITGGLLALVIGGSPTTIAVIAACAAGAGLLVSLAASLIPAALSRHFPTAVVLSEE